MSQPTEMYSTTDMFKVLELLAQGWHLYHTISKGDDYKFILARSLPERG